MKLHLADVNVWFALAVQEHEQHRLAEEWWAGLRGDCAFCRQTQIGLLRLLTTSASMNGKPLSMSAAWAVFDELNSDSRVGWLGEPDLVEAIFRKNSQGENSSPKLWTDAYLVAMAEQTESTLVTMDKALAARCPQALLLA